MRALVRHTDIHAATILVVTVFVRLTDAEGGVLVPIAMTNAASCFGREHGKGALPQGAHFAGAFVSVVTVCVYAAVAGVGLSVAQRPTRSAILVRHALDAAAACGAHARQTRAAR